MFQDGKSLVYVAIKLNPDKESTTDLYRDYLKLSLLGEYDQLLKDLGPDLHL